MKHEKYALVFWSNDQKAVSVDIFALIRTPLFLVAFSNCIEDAR